VALITTMVAPPALSRSRGTRALLWVLALAAVLRFLGLWEWSLWEDEETTIYFSFHPERPFPKGFPIFFLLLRALFSLTGVSVAAGRIMAAVIGLLSIWVIWNVARSWAGERVAILTALLLAISPAHIFWSQSIRYYGLVLLFEVCAIGLFLEGWRRSRNSLLLLSSLATALAVFTHFSGVLLIPALLTCAAWASWVDRHKPGVYRKLAAFVTPAVLLLAVWYASGMSTRRNLGGWVIPSARDPWHVAVTAVAYFGPPLFVLALASLRHPRRWALDWGVWWLLALVTLAELVTIAWMNVVNVTYYYGLVGLVGWAVLAAYGAEALYLSRRRGLTYLAIGLCAAFYAPVLSAYYVTAHGDRPRWKDAAQWIAADEPSHESRQVYASVPGTVAFHLGLDPSTTMGHPAVRGLEEAGVEAPGKLSYMVAERRVIGLSRQRWLDRFCTLQASFDAHFFWRDRTVDVYRCPTGATQHGLDGR
jgi:4-amino-4-deoxy-L-arabinose transferase-like glycosyltransferase